MNLQSLLYQLRPILKPIMPLLRRHLFIFALALLIFITYTVYTVDAIMNNQIDTEYETKKRKEGVQTTFDQDTITKIRQLKKSSEEAELPPSTTGRTNPFAE